jgi:hypothetical protein
MLVASVLIEDIEPFVVAAICGSDSSQWEEEGWGFEDDIPLILDHQDAFGDVESNLIQTDILSSHPNFIAILDIVTSRTNVFLDAEFKACDRAAFVALVNECNTGITLAECSPDM